MVGVLLTFDQILRNWRCEVSNLESALVARKVQWSTEDND